jgi:hypothetical protein
MEGRERGREGERERERTRVRHQVHQQIKITSYCNDIWQLKQVRLSCLKEGESARVRAIMKVTSNCMRECMSVCVCVSRAQTHAHSSTYIRGNKPLQTNRLHWHNFRWTVDAACLLRCLLSDTRNTHQNQVLW